MDGEGVKSVPVAEVGGLYTLILTIVVIMATKMVSMGTTRDSSSSTMSTSAARANVAVRMEVDSNARPCMCL